MCKKVHNITAGTNIYIRSGDLSLEFCRSDFGYRHLLQTCLGITYSKYRNSTWVRMHAKLFADQNSKTKPACLPPVYNGMWESDRLKLNKRNTS